MRSLLLKSRMNEAKLMTFSGDKYAFIMKLLHSLTILWNLIYWLNFIKLPAVCYSSSKSGPKPTTKLAKKFWTCKLSIHDIRKRMTLHGQWNQLWLILLFKLSHYTGSVAAPWISKSLKHHFLRLFSSLFLSKIFERHRRKINVQIDNKAYIK